jgi:hypothetical protein
MKFMFLNRFLCFLYLYGEFKPKQMLVFEILEFEFWDRFSDFQCMKKSGLCSDRADLLHRPPNFKWLVLLERSLPGLSKSVSKSEIEFADFEKSEFEWRSV